MLTPMAIQSMFSCKHIKILNASSKSQQKVIEVWTINICRICFIRFIKLIYSEIDKYPYAIKIRSNKLKHKLFLLFWSCSTAYL